VDSTPNPHTMPEKPHIELVEKHDEGLVGWNQTVQSLKRAADMFVLVELGVVNLNPFYSS
jgi:hypothetical protein